MNPLEARTLEAFLRAVSQMEKPLSQDLHQEILRVGRALENHELEVIKEIPSLVKRDVVLNEQYQSAYNNLLKQYQAQERTKSLAIAVNGSASLDLESQIAQILNADDIPGAAKRFISRLDYRLADSSKQADFWKRGDRVMALASGGAFLGVLLAQIPGAIIGGLLAAIYAWFTDPQTRSDRNG
ncbi:hypothetical protein H6G97_00715 [Nostoc flagelliforme FACHB-838]|uniref:Uncharacterized protein n=1 Tax=Nostoc flagelliforme FACHB-838 TaxID=2692904 RepID=A0ABR8DF50_9NOSO|nr:hypothetical protein [Nostoc flagelliforme]MBD2528157.1 hypothetical protein [Nostoc flagelliforme FACHB-838]